MLKLYKEFFFMLLFDLFQLLQIARITIFYRKTRTRGVRLDTEPLITMLCLSLDSIYE